MVLSLMLALLLCGAALAQDEVQPEVYFSPAGGCQEAVVKEVGNAKHDIYVQAYSFTSVPISQALIAAQQRGVLVFVQADQRMSSEKGFVGPQLAAAGIQVELDGAHPIAHQKSMIIDKDEIIAGSYNWSAQAERNSECLLVIHDERLYNKFYGNWKMHESHCKPLQPAAR